jgi:hypothetical protein
MLALERSIQALHDLTAIIRRSSASNPKFNLHPAFSKIEGFYEPYCEELAKSYMSFKFPNAKASLREQIAKSMSQRRSWLLYQIRRSKRLAEDRDSLEQQEASASSRQTIAGLDTAPLRPRKHAPGISRNANPLDQSQSHPSLASASRPTGSALKTQFRPSRSIVSQNTGFAVVDSEYKYPPKPKASQGEPMVPCSYCTEPISVLGLSEERWR